jgi:hypothetical protein
MGHLSTFLPAPPNSRTGSSSVRRLDVAFGVVFMLSFVIGMSFCDVEMNSISWMGVAGQPASALFSSAPRARSWRCSISRWSFWPYAWHLPSLQRRLRRKRFSPAGWRCLPCWLRSFSRRRERPRFRDSADHTVVDRHLLMVRSRRVIDDPTVKDRQIHMRVLDLNRIDMKDISRENHQISQFARLQ